MKPHDPTLLNKMGKALAGPLSRLAANPMAAGLARLAEAYVCVLLGKGAGAGWALEAEIQAANNIISQPRPILFDVGANIGDWAWLIQQQRPQARLFMFEPQPGCQRIITQKNIPNATLIPHAASAKTGQTVTLFTSGATDETASLHQRRDSYFNSRKFSRIEVCTITIDAVIREHNLPRVDFMKIDVEGHELAVLNGAQKSLEERLINALSFEFGSGNINSRTFFHDFWDLLTPLGYEIYRILPSARLMPITEYYEDCEYFRGVTNYVARLP